MVRFLLWWIMGKMHVNNKLPGNIECKYRNNVLHVHVRQRLMCTMVSLLVMIAVYSEELEHFWLHLSCLWLYIAECTDYFKSLACKCFFWTFSEYDVMQADVRVLKQAPEGSFRVLINTNNTWCTVGSCSEMHLIREPPKSHNGIFFFYKVWPSNISHTAQVNEMLSR